MRFNSNSVSELRLPWPCCPAQDFSINCCKRATEPESPHNHVFVVSAVVVLGFSCLWKRHLLPAAATAVHKLPNVCTTLRGILTHFCLHASHWKFSVMFVESSVLFFFFFFIIIIIVFILIFTTEHRSEPNRLVIFSGLACRCILKSGKILFCGRLYLE